VKTLDSAVPPERATPGSVLTTAPLQVPPSYNVKSTVPVGVGPVPVTNALSWTGVPTVTDWLVMSPWLASWTCVSTLALCHTLLALPLPPAAVLAAVAVVRVMTWPSTGMSEVADTTVVPTLAEVMVTVQLALAPPPV
jgi:hypothetical protein